MKRLILAFAILLISIYAYAEENSPVWVEEEGEAYMSEMDTPKEVMSRAKIDAQNKAIEKAVGVFIKSHTLISNFQFADDLVYASVRGMTEKVEIIHEGWDEKDRNLYRVRLKALIKPVYPEKGEGLSVRVAISKSELKEAEEVRIFYQADKDCYVYIFSIGADGSVTLLLPNSIYRDNYVTGGKAYEFPPEGSQIKLKAFFLPDFKENVAEEKIKIIATRKKEDIVALGFQEGMFKVYDASSTGMINDLVKKLSKLEPADWAEDTAGYRILR